MKTFISYPDKEEKVEEIIKFEPISWAELEKKQVRPIEWLVEGVIPKPSLCLIASKGGVGKTLVTLEIVRQIIEGGMFLGKYQCKKSKVLYIDGESGESEIKRRCEKLGYTKAGNKEGVEFVNTYNLNLYNIYHLLEVLKYLKENNIKVLIVDTLRPLSGDMDENNAKDVRKFMRLFMKMRDNHGITTIFLDHERKNGQNEQKYAADQNRVMGSQDKISCVDVAFSLHRNKNDVLSLKDTKTRMGKSPGRGISFTIEDELNEDGTESVVAALVDSEMAKNNLEDEIACAVIEILSEQEKAVTRELIEILRERGFGKSKIEVVLKSLSEEGRIQRRVPEGGKGYVYQLPASCLP